ncbi:uncharacterized protein LOC122071879 [Macadamia integrifolia]|uniref:uncharacterized protein LOC122071879 n=1 Tax=Macadamia integrifolia TaxID=60698 RepID=UPI001C4E36C2|nr:uncharacterized protein LOC122071879 [Macadamia integrifolia]
MDAEEMLQLFDSCWWFGDEISTEKQPSASPATDPVHEIQSKTPKPAISRLPTLLVRSRSDDLSFQRSFKSDSPSPKSVILVPKLQPILSGKEVVEVAESNTKQENIEKPVKRKRDLRWRSSSKSLSDLEFEELKGFMDLGFVFSEEDKDSSLVSIIPGLQRLGKKSDEMETIIDESKIPRPYLSEAWDLLDRRMEKNPLMNWRIPASVSFLSGNDECVIAAAKQRGIDVLLNEEPNRETPSIVSFGEKQRFQGSAGSASATMNPKSTNLSAKEVD